MKALIVIPARYDSARLPGKPTLDCEGKPLLIRTYEQACKTVADVVIACDSRTKANTDLYGLPLVVSDHYFDNGTQRVEYAYRERFDKLGYDLVINWQADEPTVSPNAVNRMIAESRSLGGITTLVNPRPLTEKQQQDEDTVKAIVMDGRCWWFSRKRVVGAMEHIGVYGFRPSTLEQLSYLKQSGSSMLAGLEQLTWCCSDIQIAAITTTRETISVNTPEDLERYREFLRSGKA